MNEHYPYVDQGMSQLVRRIEATTGKNVVWASTWMQDATTVYMWEGDASGLLHELGHWIVASDEEREWPNLMLDEWQFGARPPQNFPAWALNAKGEADPVQMGKHSWQRELEAFTFEYEVLARVGYGDPIAIQEAITRVGYPTERDSFLKSFLELFSRSRKRIHARIPETSFLDTIARDFKAALGSRERFECWLTSGDRRSSIKPLRQGAT